MTKEQLTEKADKMFAYLLQEWSKDEVPRLIDRMEKLGSLHTQAGMYMAECKKEVDSVLDGEIGKAIDGIYGDKLSTSMLNQFVKAKCGEWNYLVNRFDRLGSSAAHQIDAIRTAISYAKVQSQI